MVTMKVETERGRELMRIWGRVEEARYAAERGGHSEEHHDWCVVLDLLEREIRQVELDAARQSAEDGQPA